MELFSGLFAVFCALVLPLAAAVIIGRKHRRLIKSLLLGAACFVLFQLLLRLPLLQHVLPNMSWFVLMSMTEPLLYCLFMGFSAGLFEELGRYLIMRRFLSDRLDAMWGLAFGIGHGGIEAVLLVGINSLALLFMGGAGAAAGLVLAGGLERLSTMLLHICWSVMVMQSVRDKKAGPLIFALASHSFIDAAAAYAAIMGVSVWYIEGALLLCALAALAYVCAQLKKEKAA